MFDPPLSSSEGVAFVATAQDVVGVHLIKWDFDHLLANLPRDQRYGVHHVQQRLVMSHSLRYSDGNAPSQSTTAPHDERFARSRVSFQTFRDFLAATEEFERTRDGGRPYLGMDLLSRASKQQENMTCGPSASAGCWRRSWRLLSRCP